MREIAFIGDTHIGSRVGLWCESIKVRAGQVISASEVQLYLLDRFEKFWKGPAANVDTVALLSDLTQGTNFKDWGRGTMTPSIDTQEEVVFRLFEPHVKDRIVLGVSGSKYHRSRDTDTDSRIIKRLKGSYLGAIGNVKLRNTPGIIMNMGHGEGSPYQYPGTLLDKENLFLDASIGRGDIPHAVHLWVRGHYHTWDIIGKKNRTLFINPCWQLWFEWEKLTKFYGHKKGYQLGATVVKIYDDGRIEVIPYLVENVAVYDKLVTK